MANLRDSAVNYEPDPEDYAEDDPNLGPEESEEKQTTEEEVDEDEDEEDEEEDQPQPRGRGRKKPTERSATVREELDREPDMDDDDSIAISAYARRRRAKKGDEEYIEGITGRTRTTAGMPWWMAAPIQTVEEMIHGIKNTLIPKPFRDQARVVVLRTFHFATVGFAVVSYLSWSITTLTIVLGVPIWLIAVTRRDWVGWLDTQHRPDMVEMRPRMG